MPTQSTKIPTPVSKTNWDIFKQAGLVPTKIICEAYKPVHRSNLSCHSTLQLTADAMIRHLELEHGGGFTITFRRTNEKVWEGWDKFKEAGIELVDFRCNVCDEVLPLNPAIILRHFAPHAGKTRRPKAGGTFNMTISKEINPDYDETE